MKLIITIFVILNNVFVNSFVINNYISFLQKNIKKNRGSIRNFNYYKMNITPLNDVNNTNEYELKKITNHECRIILNMWINIEKNLNFDYPQYLHNSYFSFNTYLNNNDSPDDWYVTWSPDYNYISYLIAIKTDRCNKIFYVNRLALSPIFLDKDIDTYNLKKLLDRGIGISEFNKIDYSELFLSDNRYNLSWLLKKH